MTDFKSAMLSIVTGHHGPWLVVQAAVETESARGQAEREVRRRR